MASGASPSSPGITATSGRTYKVANIYRKYKHFNFNPGRVELIERINKVIDEFGLMGIHHLSVRQIYYQLVGQGDDNNDKEYNKVGSAIDDGRMAGLVAWDIIEDRNRAMMGLETFENPTQKLKTVLGDYYIDMWQNQEWRPYVLVEKAALEGVIGSICNELRVDYMATRGYNSQSEMWRLAQRCIDALGKGQRPIIFYLGDHDPSGIDMTRDVRDRLEMFVGTPVIVQRLGLNMPQIEQYNPPPNYAKPKDSRTDEYIARFGSDECWELDALNPLVIQELISDALLQIRDHKKWDEMLAQEAEDIREIKDSMEEIGIVADVTPEHE